MWTNKPPSQTGHQNRANIVAGPPGVIRGFQDANSSVNAWKSLFTDEMMNIIVQHTNRKIQNFRAQCTPELLQNDKVTYLHDTDNVEMSAVMGLMYARGLLGQNMHDLDALFRDKFGHPIFSATMGRNHFRFLISKIAFDNEDTCQEDGA